MAATRKAGTDPFLPRGNVESCAQSALGRDAFARVTVAFAHNSPSFFRRLFCFVHFVFVFCLMAYDGRRPSVTDRKR